MPRQKQEIEKADTIIKQDDPNDESIVISMLKKKHPGGRPKKTLDQKAFESLCIIQCTKAEICAFLDMDDVTLDRLIKENYGKSFSEVFAEKKEIGKISLRRKQFKIAEKNAAMAIFLGKNILEQRDNFEHMIRGIDIEDVQAFFEKMDEKKNGGDD